MEQSCERAQRIPLTDAAILGRGSGLGRIEEAGAEVSDPIQEVAKRANVPEDFVRQLVAADALPREKVELEVPGGGPACPVAAVLDGGGTFGRDDPYAG
jgi:hypothetical protein